MADQTDEQGESAEDGLDSVDAFSLLGDATRLEIVSTLDAAAEPPVQFSTLYDRVDVADSARFNYHLQQLIPHFVSKTGDGYELTSAARRLARAVTAGAYTEVPRLEPFAVDGACYACGADALWASYEDELLGIECRDCGESVLGVRVPPTVVRGRDPETLLDAFDDWSRLQVEQARRGICPNCGGVVEPSVSEREDDGDGFEVLASFDCTVCGRQALTSFGGLAHRHPTVEAFYRRRGESLRDRPYWEIPQYVTGDHVRVVSRDPWRVRVSFFADGDACHVDIDGDLTVVETRIAPGDAPADGE